MVLCGVLRRQWKNAVTLPHSAQWKYALLGEINQISTSNKLAPRNKVDLELLQHRLVHRTIRALIVWDNSNMWKDIELRIDPDPFCTSCQISSMNKMANSKNPLKPKAPFKWVLFILSQQQHQTFRKVRILL